jgi:hypothetical protein
MTLSQSCTASGFPFCHWMFCDSQSPCPILSGATRPSQSCLYRYAAHYPLIKRPYFHYHPAFVGQLDRYHIGQVLPAE